MNHCVPRYSFGIAPKIVQKELSKGKCLILNVYKKMLSCLKSSENEKHDLL